MSAYSTNWKKPSPFDSDEVNAIVKDLQLLKSDFQRKMEDKVPGYLALLNNKFDDKDVDNLVEYFRDPERRKEFFKEYKEIEMLYEIISPDKFMKPFLENYKTLSAIYEIVRKTYTKQIYVDKEFQRKTEQLVREHVGSYDIEKVDDLVEINAQTIQVIKNKSGGDATKVINLIKSIEKLAEDESGDPNLIKMAERAREIQEKFETRQTNTTEILQELLDEIEKNEVRKKEQTEKGFDGLTFFVYRTLLDASVNNAEQVSRKIKDAFAAHPNWMQSENESRELRIQVTSAILAEVDDVDKVTTLVNQLFTLLERAERI